MVMTSPSCRELRGGVCGHWGLVKDVPSNGLLAAARSKGNVAGSTLRSSDCILGTMTICPKGRKALKRKAKFVEFCLKTKLVSI